MKSFDLIGDIHGRADELKVLLTKLGYEKQSGCYRHPERSAIFLGDLIDRGHQNREVIQIVRSMVDAGAARAVMGNHEYNAICFHTRHPKTGHYLRPHTEKNVHQHRSFLDEFGEALDERADAVEWFSQLPLFLDLGNLRVVHACWHPEKIQELETTHPSMQMQDDLLFNSTCKGSTEWQIIETLLKGVEEKLPPKVSFSDKDGHQRTEIRTRWWHPEIRTFRDAALLFGEELSRIPEIAFPTDKIIGYPADAPPVFFGHYWLQGQPSVFRENVACLDYSVAKPGGSLCCYRWEGERRLSNGNFVSVPRIC